MRSCAALEGRGLGLLQFGLGKGLVEGSITGPGLISLSAIPLSTPIFKRFADSM